MMTLEQFLELVELQFGKKKVQPGDNFREDLHAESMDLVLLMAALEDRYGITVPESVLARVQTVEDLFNYLKSRSVAGNGDDLV